MTRTTTADPELDELLDRLFLISFVTSLQRIDVLDEFGSAAKPAPMETPKDANQDDAFMKELTAGMASMLAQLEHVDEASPSSSTATNCQENPDMTAWAEEFRRQLMAETAGDDAGESTTDFQHTLEATMARLHQSNERVSVGAFDWSIIVDMSC